MPHHVLICDDEEFIRMALADYLRSNGFEVTEAKNGVECLKAMETSSPNVLLLDLTMPEMSGHEVLAKIKAMGTHVPTYVMSGLGASDDSSDAKDLGVEGYFAKPYRLKEIAQTLKVHFAEKQG